MPDTVERLIYKLEIDDSGYIRGVENMSGSTARLVEQQNKANQTLQTNQTALKNAGEVLKRAKQDLDNYTGTNDRYRQQLQVDFDKAQIEQKKLTDLVAGNQKAYEAATKAAQDFANVSQRAANLQQQTTGGKIAPGVFTPPVNVPQVPTDISGLEESVSSTTDEFEQLAAAIKLAETAMEGLDSQSEEFKTLAPLVEQGKEVLQQYNQAVEQTAEGHQSLRTQIRVGREELVRLEQQGKVNTKEYIELEKQVAKLTDAFNDQQQRIRILASDTKLLDFGKAAITAATSAFQVYTSVAILTGDQSEELQKKTMQLFAAMQLLQSLEQLSNLTRREGALATLAQSGAQSVYTAVVGASTGALKAFRLALLGTGIGAAVVAIGFLVDRYNKLAEAQKAQNEIQKANADINEQAAKNTADEIVHLRLLEKEYENANTSQKRRKQIQDELQSTYPAYFSNLDKQADKEKFVAEQIDKVSQALILQAKIQAAQSILSKKFQDLLEEQFDPTKAVGFFDVVKSTASNLFGTLADVGSDLSETSKKNLTKAQDEYNKFEKFISDFVNKSNTELEKLGGDPKKTATKGKTGVENVFEQERQSLITKLAELRRSEATDIERINDEFAQKLIQEQIRIAKLVKDKKVTPEQGKVLISLAVEVNQEGLNKALADAKKKIDEARQKLNDELQNLQSKATLDSINLLQDDFERRRQLIDFNEQREIAEQKQATDERLKDLDDERRLKLISEQDYQRARQVIISTGEQEVNLIIQKFAQERQDLAAEVFKKSLEAYQKAITAGDFIRDEDLNAEVKKQADRFLKGQISFETFQKNITKFQREQESQRRAGEIQVLEDELSDLDRHLAAIKDTNSKEYKDTKETRDKLADTITVKKTEDTKQNVENKRVVTDERTQQIISYTSAIGDLAQAAVSFWQKANEAESAALDRSIAIQERRVDEATRIAERGNAEYLKQETDRLKELQVARENAARRDLAINAALQASQLLVGITGAIAKIAATPFGAETIAEIAIIVGALATGYGLVKSLQGNQPKLRKGEPYVRRGNNPSGIDTVPAMLNEGERVVTTEENRDYNPVLNAIHNRTIKPEILNEFVKHHHEIKPVPQPNYEKIKQVNEIKMTQDGKLAAIMQEHSKKLDENNDLQRQMLRALRTNKIDVHYDAYGLAVIQKEHMDQMAINKKL